MKMKTYAENNIRRILKTRRDNHSLDAYIYAFLAYLCMNFMDMYTVFMLESKKRTYTYNLTKNFGSNPDHTENLDVLDIFYECKNIPFGVNGNFICMGCGQLAPTTTSRKFTHTHFVPQKC